SPRFRRSCPAPGRAREKGRRRTRREERGAWRTPWLREWNSRSVHCATSARHDKPLVSAGYESENGHSRSVFPLPAPKEAMSDTDSCGFPFVDLALARRLERTEATGNAQFVEARRQFFPESKAEWIEVAGAYAMFDTVSSPITQTFGLGVFEKVTADHLKVIEDFFRERGAPVHHEISPLADMALVTLLNERGYEPFEFTSILFRPIPRDIELAAPRNKK